MRMSCSLLIVVRSETPEHSIHRNRENEGCVWRWEYGDGGSLVEVRLLLEDDQQDADAPGSDYCT